MAKVITSKPIMSDGRWWLPGNVYEVEHVHHDDQGRPLPAVDVHEKCTTTHRAGEDPAAAVLEELIRQGAVLTDAPVGEVTHG